MNILLVDDDALIRKWLILLIEQLGDSSIVLQETGSGEDALEICDRQSIDLVITDIRMPGLDGVSLLKKLTEEHPSVRTAVLSAYDDFQYIRSALQHGALDYIPKAEMKREDLIRIIEKTKQDIQLEKNVSKNNIKTQKYSDNYIKYKDSRNEKECLIKDFIKQHLILDFFSSTLSVSILKMSEETSLQNITVVATIWEEIFMSEKISALIMSAENEYLISIYCSIFTGSKRHEQYNKIMALLEQNMQKYLKIHPERSLYKEFRTTEYWHVCVNWIEYQIYYQLLWNDSQEYLPYSVSSFLSKLQLHLNIDGIDKTCALLRQEIQQLHSIYINPSEIKSVVFRARNLLIATPPLSVQGTQHNAEWEKYILDSPNLLDSKKADHYIMEFTNNLLQSYQAEKTYSTPISSACEYIHLHYSEPINLPFISASVFLSSSYFSQLFKKETGLSFGEYLEKIRIHHSQILLCTTNKTIEEIAEQVGFSNQNYFTRIFKKNIGNSPLKYRKLNQ